MMNIKEISQLPEDEPKYRVVFGIKILYNIFNIHFL